MYTQGAPALKARFIAMHSKIRRIETRFQRLFTRQSKFLGRRHRLALGSAFGAKRA
jgi:hypothetical protein